MKTLVYFGNFDEELLRAEIFASFPQWKTRDGVATTEYFGSNYDNWMLSLFVPDNADDMLLNQIVTTHDPSAVMAVDWAAVQMARMEFMNLPNWATFTSAEAVDAVNSAVLSGWTKTQVEEWVDATVTTLATAKTALKLVGDELVDLREICKKFAQMLMFLRDIVIRRNHA